jgi:hypothetical protein
VAGSVPVTLLVRDESRSAKSYEDDCQLSPFLSRKVRLFFLSVAASAITGSTALPRTISQSIFVWKEEVWFCRIEGKPPSHTKTIASSLPFSPGRLGAIFAARQLAPSLARWLSRELSLNIIFMEGMEVREEDLICRIELSPFLSRKVRLFLSAWQLAPSRARRLSRELSLNIF